MHTATEMHISGLSEAAFVVGVNFRELPAGCTHALLQDQFKATSAACNIG